MKILTPYCFFQHFIFRTPFFPFERLNKEDEWMSNNAFAEALLIASPELSGEVSKFQTTPEMPQKEKERIANSLYRYYLRACTRPTPFGLFAGCSMGSVGENTKIHLSEQKTYRRNTRLDMNYICALIQQLENDRSIREQLNYFPNNSIYPVGDKLRHVQYHYLKTRRVHKITQVDNSEYLQKILDLAKTGAKFPELAEALMDDETTKEEVSDFIHELIDTQLLVSEIEPTVTHTQPLNSLIEKLNRFSFTDNQIIVLLNEIKAQLIAIDLQPIGETVNIYPAIIKNTEKTRVAAEIKYLFQTDMFKPAQCATVSRYIMRDIQQALIFLNKITPTPSKTNLLQFRENFVKRYDDREMPLLFVLDNELGIGYADNTSGDVSHLVDDLAIARGPSSSNASRSPVQSIINRKYRQSTQKVIELTDEDVKGVEAAWDDLPPTFSVICQLLQDDGNGRSIYIKSVGGHCATNLLGRFCHLDEKILNHTLAITEKESQMNPDVIFAEIVHLPESRIGNILLRPVLRPYEIPYLAKSGVSREFELNPGDLYVSVKNNRILLRSKRLNREIIPRMSTAHNYSGPHAMPVYQFLCDMQNQNGRSGLGFYWDEAAQQFHYLPRVVYKNCILSKARWTVQGKEVEPLAGIKENSELLQKVKDLRSSSNIPAKVLLADSDNELYVDMNSPLSIRAWLSAVKKRPSFYLEEFLFEPETAIVHGPEGVFNNEFIFSFYRESIK